MDVENGNDIITQETIRDDLKKIVETETQIVAIENKMDEIKKQESCCSLNIEIIQNTINDQDFQQKLAFIPLVSIELYRVLVSSLLVLFVPQKCVDHVCSLSENMVWEHHLYNAGLIVNFITLFSFLSLYYCEVKRENRLITYLDVNKNSYQIWNIDTTILNTTKINKNTSFEECKNTGKRPRLSIRKCFIEKYNLKPIYEGIL